VKQPNEGEKLTSAFEALLTPDLCERRPVDDAGPFAPHTPLESHSVSEGMQYVFRFANGRGASVVRHRFSYGREQGLWELAVIAFDGKGWTIDYSTDITDDVLGWLKVPDVVALLDRITALESRVSALEAKSE
jgi:hypothetical protein